jgi:hypothetical protein
MKRFNKMLLAYRKLIKKLIYILLHSKSVKYTLYLLIFINIYFIFIKFYMYILNPLYTIKDMYYDLIDLYIQLYDTSLQFFQSLYIKIYGSSDTQHLDLNSLSRDDLIHRVKQLIQHRDQLEDIIKTQVPKTEDPQTKITKLRILFDSYDYDYLDDLLKIATLVTVGIIGGYIIYIYFDDISDLTITTTTTIYTYLIDYFFGGDRPASGPTSGPTSEPGPSNSSIYIQDKSIKGKGRLKNLDLVDQYLKDKPINITKTPTTPSGTPPLGFVYPVDPKSFLYDNDTPIMSSRWSDGSFDENTTPTQSIILPNKKSNK